MHRQGRVVVAVVLIAAMIITFKAVKIGLKHWLLSVLLRTVCAAVSSERRVW